MAQLPLAMPTCRPPPPAYAAGPPLALTPRPDAVQDVSLENMLLYPRGDGEWQVRLCDPGQAAPLTFDEVTGAELPTEFHGYVAKQFRPPELYSKRPYMATKARSLAHPSGLWLGFGRPP